MDNNGKMLINIVPTYFSIIKNRCTTRKGKALKIMQSTF